MKTWLIGAVLALFAVAPAAAETYRMRYEAAVLGVVTIGTASYEVSTSSGGYVARASVETSGLARLFDQTRLQASASGAVTPAGPVWRQYDLAHAYATKSRRVRLTRAGGAVSADVAPRYGNMGEPPASAADQARSYDPLTAFFALGRQIAASGACNGRAFVFDGRGHYRLAAGGGTRGTFDGGGYRGPAIRCSLRYEPISGFTNLEAQRRAPLAEAWFGLPGGDFAPLLQLTAPTPLGAARLDVRAYQGP